MAVVGESTEYCRAFLVDVEFRSIDEDARTATFVAATENPVRTFFGFSVLRMSGVSLARYKKNPVVLDAHDMSSTGAVIGRAIVRKVGRTLLAVVTFATTERAEEIWTLVRTGFVKAVSIGFRPNHERTLVLGDGETNGTGANRVTGPARVHMEWELQELSILPVGADEDTVRQGNWNGGDGVLSSGVRELVLGEVRKAMADKESVMSEETQGPADVPEVSGAITPPEGTRTEVPGTLETALRSSDVPPLAEELAARRLSALSASIRSICPSGLESVADVCILEGKTLDESRAMLVAARSELAPSLGTPEPLVPEAGDGAADGERSLDDVSDRELVSALHF